LTGPQGNTGPQGATGPAGPKGTAGANGESGVGFSANIQLPASVATTLYSGTALGLGPTNSFSINGIFSTFVPLAKDCSVTGMSATVAGASVATASSLTVSMAYAPASFIAGSSVYGGPGGPVACTLVVPAGTTYASCSTTGTEALAAGWLVGYAISVNSGAAALSNAHVYASFRCAATPAAAASKPSTLTRLRSDLVRR
jgi:hypothetical protein